MKTKRSLTTKPTFHSYPVLANETKGLAVDEDILRRIEAQFDYAEDAKSKALFYRLDLRYPDGAEVPADNAHFRRFASTYMKNLARQGLKPQYFAVREQSKRHNGCHYHMGVLVDGQKTRNCYGHLATAERLWEHELGLPPKEGGYGLVNRCDKDKKTGERMLNGMMLDPNRDNYEDLKDTCFRRSSYLAKENTKGTPKGVREYFASRLPKEYLPAKPKKSKANKE